MHVTWVAVAFATAELYICERAFLRKRLRKSSKSTENNKSNNFWGDVLKNIRAEQKIVFFIKKKTVKEPNLIRKFKK
jgi:hypothetical protein